MDAAADDTLIGQRIFGGYVITGKIGSGGMGAVYVAENRDLGRKLGVKVLLAERLHSTQAVARFFAEAKAASAIRHRNIIDVLDAATLPDGRHYILMEHLDGSTLRAFARKHFPLTLEMLLSVLGQVCAGLQAAHNRGIIHRDLKPSNIFVAPEPDNPFLTKILDFGIAKLSAPDLESDAHTKSRTVAGTPYYMSPEQARALRDVDQRTDIYAVGVIAYEMITGRPPYVAASAGDLVYQQQTMKPAQPIEICTDLPEAWNQLIVDTIDLDPKRRPQSARELADRMIAATAHGREIARAAAPLLFAATAAPSDPISGESSRPLAVPNWSQSSMPGPSAGSTSGTSLPPARPPQTAAATPRARRESRPQQSGFPDPTVAPAPRAQPSGSPRGSGGQRSGFPDPTVAPPSGFGSAFPTPHPSSDFRSSPPSDGPASLAPGSRPSVERSHPPPSTQDLRSGDISFLSGALDEDPFDSEQTRIARPPAAGVPTTLGLSASEMPVFEGTAVASERPRPRRTWLTIPAAAAMILAGIGVAWFLRGRPGGGDGASRDGLERPIPAAAGDPKPTVEPIDTAMTTRDAGTAAQAVTVDAAAVETDAGERAGAGADGDAAAPGGDGDLERGHEPEHRSGEHRNPRDRRHQRDRKQQQGDSGKLDAGVGGDDALFDSRK